jgi:GNAT superfamily N-acetyltransferase
MTLTICKSSDRDTRQILHLHRKEHQAAEQADRELLGDLYVPSLTEGFYWNSKLIRKAHKKGELYVLREGDKCVAYHFKSDEMGIVYVRPNRRGNGYGHMLVARWLAAAAKNDEPYAAVECAPSTSRPFWTKMGFTLIKYCNRQFAYRILDKQFPLDPEAELVDVEITFYESREAYDETKPLHTYRARAVKVPDSIQLADRVTCLELNRHDTLTVKITVDGEVVCFGRARSSQAKALGVKRYAKGFYPAYYCDALTISGETSTQE